MIEELPVLETEVIEPDGVDLSLYRRIGEEVTRVVRHKLGDALCKGNQCAQGQHAASIRGTEKCGGCSHAADACRQVHR